MRAPRSRTPRYVLVLGQRQDVRVRETTMDIPADTDSHALLGQCDTDADEIRIAKTHGGEPVGTDRYTETLLHETLHAMTAIADMRDLFKGDDDEAFVGRFSPVLLDFIRRNKGVIAWLQRRD